MPVRYAFEREAGSDRVVIHRAVETYPGTEAETKCRPGEVRTFVALGASQWPRAHDLGVRHFSGVPTLTCPVCFALKRYSSVRVSMGGVVLREVDEIGPTRKRP